MMSANINIRSWSAAFFFLTLMLLSGSACQVAPALNKSVSRYSPAPNQEVARAFLGSWNGQIERGGYANTLIAIRFAWSDDDRMMGECYIPSWGANWWKLSIARVEPKQFEFYFQSPSGQNGKFSARLINTDTLTGSYSWNGIAYPFRLERKPVDEDAFREQLNTQIPKPPFPYRTEVVRIKSGNIMLSGGLTIPDKPAKPGCILLLPGTNPVPWNPDIPGKPGGIPWMWFLADHLSRAGVATLRLDPRGLGQSGGNYEQSTITELADDAVAAANYLSQRSDLDSHHIGILGLSEGAIIAPIAAVRTKQISFIVLISATAIPLDESFIQQDRRINSLFGDNTKDAQNFSNFFRALLPLLKTDLSTEAIIREIVGKFGKENDLDHFSPALLEHLVRSADSPRLRSEVRYVPADSLSRLDIPLLALFGTEDPFLYAEVNAKALEASLRNSCKNNATVVTFPNVGHWLEERNNGPVAPTSFKVAAEPLDVLSKWVVQHVGHDLRWKLESVHSP